MSRSQTLLFPSATHVCVPFKAGCVMLRLPPPSVSRNGAPSFALFLWFVSFPLSFFFVKSGLPHGEAQPASPISISLVTSATVLWTTASHFPRDTALCASPPLFRLQLSWPCPGCLPTAQNGAFPASHDSIQNQSESSMVGSYRRVKRKQMRRAAPSCCWL